MAARISLDFDALGQHVASIREAAGSLSGASNAAGGATLFDNALGKGGAALATSLRQLAAAAGDTYSAGDKLMRRLGEHVASVSNHFQDLENRSAAAITSNLSGHGGQPAPNPTRMPPAGAGPSGSTPSAPAALALDSDVGSSLDSMGLVGRGSQIAGSLPGVGGITPSVRGSGPGYLRPTVERNLERRLAGARLRWVAPQFSALVTASEDHTFDPWYPLNAATAWSKVAHAVADATYDVDRSLSSHMSRQSGLAITACTTLVRSVTTHLDATGDWCRQAASAVEVASEAVERVRSYTDLTIDATADDIIGAARARDPFPDQDDAQFVEFVAATTGSAAHLVSLEVARLDRTLTELKESIEALTGVFRDVTAAFKRLAQGKSPGVASHEGIPTLDGQSWPAGKDPAAVKAWWDDLPPSARADWIRLHPDLVGNTDGIDYDSRIRANHLNLELELARARTRLNTLQHYGHSPEDAEEIAALRRRIAQWEKISKSYATPDADESAASVDGRKLIAFDPSRGIHAELVGRIDDRTTSIGVLVPGTGSNMGKMEDEYDRASAFTDKSGGSLAMITWMGGDMPQEIVPDATKNHYAKDLGPKLTDFVGGIDRPNGVDVTVLGHSYGGSIVGAAEASGMKVDRIVHVESAGAGPDVRSVNAYAAPDTQRFTFMAPLDPILIAQNANPSEDIGHGASTLSVDGFERAETGWKAEGDPSHGFHQGVEAHSGVFEEGSTSWNSMYKILTGEGKVEAESGVYLDHVAGTGKFSSTKLRNGFESPHYDPTWIEVE